MELPFPPLPPSAAPSARQDDPVFRHVFSQLAVGMECDAGGGRWATGAFGVTNSWQGGLGGSGFLLR